MDENLDLHVEVLKFRPFSFEGFVTAACRTTAFSTSYLFLLCIDEMQQ